MKYVLFDFDGTLSDSSEGIINTFIYTLKKLGYTVPSIEVITTFIGPPIIETFSKTLGMDEETTKKAIAIFREEYGKNGKFQNNLYDGVLDMLTSLKEKGYVLGVATSKPEVYSIQILEYFGIAHFFDVVVGASLDDKLSKKIDIMTIAIEKGKQRYDIESITMVGDRCYDMNSSRLLGVGAIGVTYGFGSEEELLESGANVICHSPEEVKNYILTK